MTSACSHPKVTVYWRLIYPQTYFDPAEYAFRIMCDECGDELEETPPGAVEREIEQEDDIDE